MKITRLLRRDVSLGLTRFWFLFLIPILVALLQSMNCHRTIEVLEQEELLFSNVSIMDYQLFCTKGMHIFYFNPREYFTIPIYWFVFQIGISYIIGYYPHNDFVENGQNLFLALRDRKSWWNSKCLWCILNVFLYYSLYEATIMVAGCLWGAKLQWKYSADFIMPMYGFMASKLSVTEAVYLSFLLPCLVTASLCLFQIFFGFLSSPVFSFACICATYVLSAYYTSDFLPGNYTMWLRSNYVVEDGVQSFSGAVIGIVILFFSWKAGQFFFQEKDIMPAHEG